MAPATLPPCIRTSELDGGMIYRDIPRLQKRKEESGTGAAAAYRKEGKEGSAADQSVQPVFMRQEKGVRQI